MSSKKLFQDFRGPSAESRLLSPPEGDLEEDNLSQSLPHSYARGRFFSIAGLPTQNERDKDRKSRSRKRKQKSAREILDEEEGAVDLTYAARRHLHRVRTGAKSLSTSLQSPMSPLDHMESARNSREFDESLPRSHANDYHCLVARTALVLPFKWANAMDADLADWIQHSLERTIVGPEGEKVALWQMRQQLPYEMTDLDPHFRELLGAGLFYDDEEDLDFDAIYHKSAWRAPAAPSTPRAPKSNSAPAAVGAPASPTSQDSMDGVEDDDDPLDDYCQRLEINPAVLDSLFAKPRLCATLGSTGEEDAASVICPVKFESIEMVAFPLGTAILVVHVNWIPEDGMTLEELRSWLHLSKYQYKVPGVLEGWLFRGDYDDRHDFPEAHLKSLGGQLTGAIYDKTPVSLSTIGNWLLSGEDEEPDAPPNRLGRYLKRCYHHTCVVIDKKPTTAELQEYLFHLRRAQGNENRPSPTDSSVDAVLIPRTNRYIGISRAGTACLSWPTSSAELDFEVNKWQKKFMGIYLILSAHVYGEKSVLLELSNLSSDSAKLLKGIHRVSLSEMYSSRMALIKLATLMTRYTLQMSSDDCGGLPEYVEFFTALRSLFGIRQQRNELREEIQDVLALIETNYNEEQRKLRALEKQERAEGEARERAREKQSEAFKARYERFVTVVSSFTIPIVLVSGIWGMNVDDLPQWPFWPLIGVTTCCSLTLLVILVCIFRRPPQVEEEEDRLVVEATKKGALNVAGAGARDTSFGPNVPMTPFPPNKRDPTNPLLMEDSLRRRLGGKLGDSYGSLRGPPSRHIDFGRAHTIQGGEYSINGPAPSYRSTGSSSSSSRPFDV